MQFRTRLILEVIGIFILTLVLAAAITFLAATRASGGVSVGPVLDTTRAVVINQPIMGNGLAILSEHLLKFAKKDPTKPVTIIISSPGGSVTEGMRFIDVMEEIKLRGTKINCVVIYGAASMAFQILAHCDTRIALATSMFLWHQPAVFAQGVMLNPDTLENILLDLHATETLILSTLHRLPIDEKALLFHYHRGTMHFSHQIETLMPGWLKIYDVIPGLLELDTDSIPHLEAPMIFQGAIPDILYIDPTVVRSLQGGK